MTNVARRADSRLADVGLARRVGRALVWQCPLCGGGPMFRPWREVRSFPAWGVPLAECATCGRSFHREPGYYLLAVWGLDYGITAVMGLALYAACWSLPTTTAMWIVLPPLPVFAIAIARHTKALYFAFDTWLDPPRHPGSAG